MLEGKGIAFITFQTEEGAQKAVEYNNTQYNGRTLRINLTADKQQGRAGDRGERGGGRGGRGGRGGGGRSAGDKDGGRPKAAPNKQIVVRNLSFNATEESIRGLFEECGKRVRLVMSVGFRGQP